MRKFALAVFSAAAAILSARGHGTHSIKQFVGDTNQYIHDDGWVKTSTLGGVPFVDESASVIFAPNTLNNMSITAVDQLLDEWYRVLQPGGVVCVLDFKALAKLYAGDGMSLAAFTDITTISGDSQTWYVGNPGQSYFTLSNFALSNVCSPLTDRERFDQESLANRLEHAGFVGLRTWHPDNVPPVLEGIKNSQVRCLFVYGHQLTYLSSTDHSPTHRISQACWATLDNRTYATVNVEAMKPSGYFETPAGSSQSGVAPWSLLEPSRELHGPSHTATRYDTEAFPFVEQVRVPPLPSPPLPSPESCVLGCVRSNAAAYIQATMHTCINPTYNAYMQIKSILGVSSLDSSGGISCESGQTADGAWIIRRFYDAIKVADTRRARARTHWA